MSVFVLTMSDNHCCYCDDIEGIYSTLEKAKAEGDVIVARKHCVIINEWEVDGKVAIATWCKAWYPGAENAHNCHDWKEI